MNIIVAVDKNWAIGKDNKLLVSYSGRYEDVSPGNNWKSCCYGT